MKLRRPLEPPGLTHRPKRSPNAQFGWSIAATRGRNSMRRLSERERKKMGAREGTKRAKFWVVRRRGSRGGGGLGGRGLAVEVWGRGGVRRWERGPAEKGLGAGASGAKKKRGPNNKFGLKSIWQGPKSIWPQKRASHNKIGPKKC